ncbi:MAG: Gfo/Idh/MocA family protein [Candidatus Sumerlaeota bacterium]
MTEKQIRTAIIGLGRAGWGMHCTELDSRPEMFEIAGGCDTYEPWRERFAERFPDARVTADMQELFDDDSIEMVSIATRSCDHHDHAMAALEAGKIVFLEKPICRTYDEALSLQEASKKYPGKLFIRHNRRFEPSFIAIREIIDSGIIGELVQMKLARTSYGRRNDWQTLLEFGGGQLSNWGSHIIDHGLQFLGAPEHPLKALHGYLNRVAAVGDAEDHVKIMMTGADDAVVDIEISGGAALPAPQYLVWGKKGALEYWGGEKIKMRFLDPSVELPPREAFPGVPGSEFVVPSGKQSLEKRTIGSNFGTPETLPWIEEERDIPEGSPRVIWDHLYGAIRQGQTFQVSLDEAVEVMRVTEEIRKGTAFEMK